MALGDADDDPDAKTTRWYWHICIAGAVPLVASITECFNRSAVPFRVKVLDVPSAFCRTDAAVLYVPRKHVREALPLISEVWRDCRKYLNTAVSAFVKPMAPGLGVAEDPGLPISFGQHASRLVAAALATKVVTTYGSPLKRLRAMREHMRANKFDVERPFLDHGSADIYPIIA
jgi:hypothetical protein